MILKCESSDSSEMDKGTQQSSEESEDTYPHDPTSMKLGTTS